MMTVIRLLVYGGRRYDDKRRVWTEMDSLTARYDKRATIVIHGDATGADAHAKAWAVRWKDAGVIELPFPADWKNITRHGAIVRFRIDVGHYDIMAGFVRNQRMIDEGKPTHALEFPGGSGTADMRARIMKANQAGAAIKLRIVLDQNPIKRARTDNT